MMITTVCFLFASCDEWVAVITMSDILIAILNFIGGI